MDMERRSVRSLFSTRRSASPGYVPMDEYGRVVDKLQTSERRNNAAEAENRALLQQVARLERELHRTREKLERAVQDLEQERAEHGRDEARLARLMEWVECAERRDDENSFGQRRPVATSTGPGVLEFAPDILDERSNVRPLSQHSRFQHADNTLGGGAGSSDALEVSSTRDYRETRVGAEPFAPPITNRPRRPSWQAVRGVLSRGAATARRVSGTRSISNGSHRHVLDGDAPGEDFAVSTAVSTSSLPNHPVATAVPPCLPRHAHEWRLKGTNKRVRKYTCRYCNFWAQEKPDAGQGCWVSLNSGRVL